jgi:hypothetical protein
LLTANAFFLDSIFPFQRFQTFFCEVGIFFLYYQEPVQLLIIATIRFKLVRLYQQMRFLGIPEVLDSLNALDLIFNSGEFVVMRLLTIYSNFRSSLKGRKEKALLPERNRRFPKLWYTNDQPKTMHSRMGRIKNTEWLQKRGLAEGRGLRRTGTQAVDHPG